MLLIVSLIILLLQKYSFVYSLIFESRCIVENTRKILIWYKSVQLHWFFCICMFLWAEVWEQFLFLLLFWRAVEPCYYLCLNCLCWSLLVYLQASQYLVVKDWVTLFVISIGTEATRFWFGQNSKPNNKI